MQGKKTLFISALVFGSCLSGQAIAGAQVCSNVSYSPKDDTQLHILTHVEPELVQPTSKQKDSAKKSQQSVSWFSWLTESHTMPNLHFIDILELFGKNK